MEGGGGLERAGSHGMLVLLCLALDSGNKNKHKKDKISLTFTALKPSAIVVAKQMSVPLSQVPLLKPSALIETKCSC